MKKIGLLVLCLFVMLLLSLLPVFVQVPENQNVGVGGSSKQPIRALFRYRRPISIITESLTEDLYDFQILIELNTQELIMNNKMLPTGDDIRVTDSDGETELPFCIEEDTLNTTATRIWVKVPYIPHGTTKTIYLYYGNTTEVEGKSNATATFDWIYVGRENVNYQWKTITLPSGIEFEDPVLIIVATSANEEAPMPVVRVRNLNSYSFEMRLVELIPPYGSDADDHGYETVHYFIINQGMWKTIDGRMIEARKFNTTASTHGRTTTLNNWATVSFTYEFPSVPTVFSTIVSYNTSDYIHVKTRQRSVSTLSFQVAMEEGGINNDEPQHCMETIAWVALERGIGNNFGVPYEINNTADIIDHAYTATNGHDIINFTQTFTSTPAFFAWMQTRDGPDASLVRYISLSPTAATVYIDEDSSYDVWHTTEIVGYMAWGALGLSYVRKYAYVEPTVEVGDEELSVLVYKLSVVDHDGTPVEGASVVLTGQNEGFVYADFTPSSGNLTFNVVPDNYSLVISLLCGSVNVTFLNTYVLINDDIEETRTLDVIKYQFIVYDRGGTTPIQGIIISFYDNTTFYNTTSQPGGTGEIYLPYLNVGLYNLTAWQSDWSHQQINITDGVEGADYVMVNGTTSQFINIRITTIATAPPTSTLELIVGDVASFANWSEVVTFQVSLFSGNVPLNVSEHNGHVDCYIFRDSNLVLSFIDLNSSVKGYYDLSFNTSLLDAGYTYILKFNATLENYQDPVPLNVYLTVYPVPTESRVVWDSSIAFNDSFTIKVYYEDILHGCPVKDAEVVMDIWGTNYTHIVITDFNESLGAYVYSIDHFISEEKTFSIVVSLSKENYESQTEKIFITINKRLASITTNVTGVATYYGDPIAISLTIDDITDINNPFPLGDGQILYEVVATNVTPGGEIGNYSIILSGSISISQGSALLSLLDTTALTPGTYLIKLRLSRDHYTSTEASVAVTVSEIPLAIKTVSLIDVKKDLTGKGSAEISFTVIDIAHNVNFTEVVATYELYYGGELILSGNVSCEDNVFRLTISFDTREVGVYILILKVYANYTTGAEAKITINVDYIGGHITIAGHVVPLYIFVPSALGAAIVVSLISYKVIQYYRTPVEVRFLNKIISALQRGKVPEIEYLSRDEEVNAILSAELERLEKVAGGGGGGA